MKVYVNGNTIEIHMTRKEAVSCSHSGPCDTDCSAMVSAHPRLFARMPRSVLISAFKEYGTWSYKELQEKSEFDLRVMACWLAASDIVEENSAGGWTVMDGAYGMAHPEYLTDRK